MPRSFDHSLSHSFFLYLYKRIKRLDNDDDTLVSLTVIIVIHHVINISKSLYSSRNILLLNRSLLTLSSFFNFFYNFNLNGSVMRSIHWIIIFQQSMTIMLLLFIVIHFYWLILVFRNRPFLDFLYYILDVHSWWWL